MSQLSEGLIKVIAKLEGSLERLSVDTCEEIFKRLDSYGDVAWEDLEVSIGRNMRMAVSSLKAGQAPEPEALDDAATTTTERFHSGVSIDQVILAFRMSFSRIHERFIDESFKLLSAEELVHGSQVLSRVSDSFTVRAVGTFHKLVVESAIADASRRAAALRNLFAGEFTFATEGAALQINSTERYAAIRASIPDGVNSEQARRNLEQSGGKPSAPAVVVIEDDNDCIGIVTKRPMSPERVVVGMGPFVEVLEMPLSDRVASEALNLAISLGRTGVQGIAELSWRLAAVQALDVDMLFRHRFIEPVSHQGEFSLDLLGTVHAWILCGRSIPRTAEDQRVHVNTVRYRISRFSELTGFDPESLDDLIGLAWALEMPQPAPRNGLL